MAVSFVKACLSSLKLEPDWESEALAHISAEGIAKLNRDALAGHDLSQTAKELVMAYKHAMARRQMLLKTIPADLLAKYGSDALPEHRPLELDELAVFARMPREWLDTTIRQRLKQVFCATHPEKLGSCLDAILEELAFEFKHQQLQWDAQLIKRQHPEYPLTIVPLHTTTFAASSASSACNSPAIGCSTSNSLPNSPKGGSSSFASRLLPSGSPNLVRLGLNGKLRIGFSPVTVWFTETPSVFSCDIAEQFGQFRTEQQMSSPNTWSSLVLAAAAATAPKGKKSSLSLNPIRSVRFSLPEEAEDAADAPHLCLQSPLRAEKASVVDGRNDFSSILTMQEHEFRMANSPTPGGLSFSPISPTGLANESSSSLENVAGLSSSFSSDPAFVSDTSQFSSGRDGGEPILVEANSLPPMWNSPPFVTTSPTSCRPVGRSWNHPPRETVSTTQQEPQPQSGARSPSLHSHCVPMHRL